MCRPFASGSMPMHISHALQHCTLLGIMWATTHMPSPPRFESRALRNLASTQHHIRLCFSTPHTSATSQKIHSQYLPKIGWGGGEGCGLGLSHMLLGTGCDCLNLSTPQPPDPTQLTTSKSKHRKALDTEAGHSNIANYL